MHIEPAANAAAWARVAAATRDNHYTAWGDGVLVNVHYSKLVTALPKMRYVAISGQQHLPLNVIVHLLGRLGWVEDNRLQIDLASGGLSAATLASFEDWAVTDGRLDWTPTSETAFLQRVLSLAAELGAAGALPAALKVTADSFVPFEGRRPRRLLGRPRLARLVAVAHQGLVADARPHARGVR